MDHRNALFLLYNVISRVCILSVHLPSVLSRSRLGGTRAALCWLPVLAARRAHRVLRQVRSADCHLRSYGTSHLHERVLAKIMDRNVCMRLEAIFGFEDVSSQLVHDDRNTELMSSAAGSGEIVRILNLHWVSEVHRNTSEGENQRPCLGEKSRATVCASRNLSSDLRMCVPFAFLKKCIQPSKGTMNTVYIELLTKKRCDIHCTLGTKF